ncbi:2-dehydropantoate 2-reductase [Bradyrhizobium sp.]|uniref:2-dehydropantoate 2-reductase n=1 Tax=Bradyrhizobium sp. TaxID=376 RepID=UPI002D75F9F5|nr:2-dehydropantoate 2-reductase [Bradyrhizobium sp.]HZR76781.1 2-dehydropantoate 2-reductase [Bradyrhizobium sp.]
MPPPAANSKRQRIAVIGLGSIGGVVAGMLGAAGRHDIVACVRRPIARMTVECAGGTIESPLPALTDPHEAQPQDWVLLCTKVQDTAASAPWLQRLCGPATRVAALQNGIGHAENLAPFTGRATVIPTIVYYNSERLAPDRVRYRRGSEYDFAVADDTDGQAFAALFDGTMLRTLLSGDFKTLAWRKLLVNAVANPVSALTLQRNAVFRREDVAALCLALLEEAVTVGRADGARLATDEAAQTMARLTAIPPDAGSSMYFDRLAGRPLEIDALTGAVVELAERHRVPTPLLKMLLTLARAASDGPALPRH